MADCIDREEAKKLFRTNFGSVMDAVIAERLLDEVPTAAANHGRWHRTGREVFGDCEYECTNCHETFWEGNSWAERAKYCMNCVAIMGLEDE